MNERMDQDDHPRDSFDDITMQLDESLELGCPMVQERKSLEQPSLESGCPNKYY